MVVESLLAIMIAAGSKGESGKPRTEIKSLSVVAATIKAPTKRRAAMSDGGPKK